MVFSLRYPANMPVDSSLQQTLTAPPGLCWEFDHWIKMFCPWIASTGINEAGLCRIGD